MICSKFSRELLFEDGIGKAFSKGSLFLSFSNGGWLIFQNWTSLIKPTNSFPLD